MDDKTLRQQVIDELDWDPSVDAASIGVTAAAGIVTLSGHVASYAEKLRAEAAAKRVKGVHAIAEEIEVRLDCAPRHSDQEVAHHALEALDWDVMLPSAAIQLKVAHGWVTLSGELDWEYQRRAAEADVRKLSGVVGVTNAITLRPKFTPADVSQRIRDALERDAELESRAIQVSVTGDRVRLDGAVHTWRERDAVERAAWSAPGVRAVEDHVRVAG
ncbi:MAG: BON domain-containing protein [Caulobacterales bacterium]